MILIKIHKTPNGETIAMCDKDLIGKTFEENELSLTVSENFYNGREISDKKELLKIIKNAPNMNIVGKESVDFAIKNHLIDKNSVILIKKVPYTIKILT